MNDRELLREITDHIEETIQAHLDYEGYKDKESSEYERGYKDALHDLGTDLLGRKSEDAVQILDQHIKGTKVKPQ
jgi:hypothetical protein